MLDCKDHYNNFPEINKISRNKQYSYTAMVFSYKIALTIYCLTATRFTLRLIAFTIRYVLHFYFVLPINIY